MKPGALEEIAGVVEALTEHGSYAVEHAISVAIGRPENWHGFQLPAYTRSVDAALTLAPEGWWLAGLNFNHADFRSKQDRDWHAEFGGPVTWVDYDGFPEPQFDCEGGNAATPALALCAAALRAQSHLSGKVEK
jgi:hypothetical protein